MCEKVRLQLEDFSVDAELARMRSTSKRIGGIATFVGCARDFSEGRDVSFIDFDAYPAMAMAELNTLRETALKKFALIDAHIVHRIGQVQAGDNIVLIVTGAEHRAPALQACQWLIDELKKCVPIWKKETTPQGESWVTPHP